MVPASFCRRHALLLARHDVQRQHRQHRAVHGHRHGHVGQRNAVEQRAHVVDGVDRHARHADVAAHARMVAVVAAVGGEIEGHREALLPGRDVAPVEGVGVLRRREPGVLADGPRLRHVHGRVGPAQIGRDAGIAVEEVEARPYRPPYRPASPRCPRASARGCRRSAPALPLGVCRGRAREIGIRVMTPSDLAPPS